MINANLEYLEDIGYRETGRLLVGKLLYGISYANRLPDAQGIYWCLAFLPFDTLDLDVNPNCPGDLLEEISTHAEEFVARGIEKTSPA